MGLDEEGGVMFFSKDAIGLGQLAKVNCEPPEHTGNRWVTWSHHEVTGILIEELKKRSFEPKRSVM